MIFRASFVHPPFLDKYSESSRSPAVIKSGAIYFPLWLCYAIGVMDKEGYSMKMLRFKRVCLRDIIVFCF